MPLNEAIAKVTTRTTAQFHSDIAALGVLPPSVEPTCTSHIPQMVAMTQVLIDKGFAYAAEGHVLLDTTAVPDYGQLSGRSLDEMIAGARVEVAPYKRNPADSVLWKPSSDAQPGWESPWGRGRPGWHIECSAMAKQHLGEVFDIHGGGIDLVFPHHENELAQSRCAHGTAVMANVWMHNGFLQVEGEKMSKIARQLRHDQRVAGDGSFRRAELARPGAALRHARHAVSATHRLDRRPARAGTRVAGRVRAALAGRDGGRCAERRCAGGAERRSQHAKRHLDPARARQVGQTRQCRDCGSIEGVTGVPGAL